MNARITPDTNATVHRRAREHLGWLTFTDWVARVIALAITSFVLAVVLFPLGHLFDLMMLRPSDDVGALPIFAMIAATVIVSVCARVLFLAVHKGRKLFYPGHQQWENEVPLEKESSRELLVAWDELCRSDKKFAGIRCFAVDCMGAPNACIQKINDGTYQVLIDRRILNTFPLTSTIGIMAHELGHRESAPDHEGWWYHFGEMCDDIIFFLPTVFAVVVLFFAKGIAEFIHEFRAALGHQSHMRVVPEMERTPSVTGRYIRYLFRNLLLLLLFAVTLPTWFRMWQTEEYRADTRALLLAGDLTGLIRFLRKRQEEEVFVHENFFSTHPNCEKRARSIAHMTEG